MIFKDCTSHASKERNFDSIREKFLNLGADNETWFKRMRCHCCQISLDLLQQFRVICLGAVKFKERTSDNLGCLSLHDDVNEIAHLFLLSLCLVEFDESSCFILKTEMNHVALRLL